MVQGPSIILWQVSPLVPNTCQLVVLAMGNLFGLSSTVHSDVAPLGSVK